MAHFLGSPNMRRSLLVGMVIVTVALMVGTGSSQEKKTKVSLPQYWNKLDLSKDQATKIRAIGTDYQAKIHVLEKQIADLKSQRRAAQYKVLNENQKEKLKKILLGETSEDKKATP